METPNWQVKLLANVEPGTCILDNDSSGAFIAVAVEPNGDSVGMVRVSGPDDQVGQLRHTAKVMRPTVVELADVVLELDHSELTGLISVGHAEKSNLLKRGSLLLLGDHARILLRNDGGELLAASLRDGSLVPLSNPNAMICPINNWRLVRRVGNEVREVYSSRKPAPNG
jgi:hypothetical protein